MGHMGGLINPRPGRGQYRADFSNTGESPKPRKRAPCQKKKKLFFSVDGVWSIWSDWDTCTVTCGGGTHNRMRTCDSPAPANGGGNCVGDSTEPSSCNNEGCAG